MRCWRNKFRRGRPLCRPGNTLTHHNRQLYLLSLFRTLHLFPLCSIRAIILSCFLNDNFNCGARHPLGYPCQAVYSLQIKEVPQQNWGVSQFQRNSLLDGQTPCRASARTLSSFFRAEHWFQTVFVSWQTLHRQPRLTLLISALFASEKSTPGPVICTSKCWTLLQEDLHVATQ